MSSKKYPLWLRLVAAGAAIVIFVLVVELALRLAGVEPYFQNRFFTLNRALDYPDVFLRDRTLFWRFQPDRMVTSKYFEGKTYRINTLGLRGDDIPLNKTKKRIITLGNSCTFGWGLSDDSIYPTGLEKNLDSRYEVINGGIPGYTSYQGRRFFESDLVRLKPDIVTFMFSWNDHWAAASQIADKDQQFPPEVIIDLQNFFARFQFYRLIKKVLLSAVETSPDSTFDRQNIVYRVGVEDYAFNMKALCDRAREVGAIPILLTSPIPDLAKYYPPGVRSPLHAYHEKYNQAVRNLAESQNIALVDLAQEFDREENLWDDAPRDPIHFNARGHALAARLIAHYIEANIGY